MSFIANAVETIDDRTKKCCTILKNISISTKNFVVSYVQLSQLIFQILKVDRNADQNQNMLFITTFVLIIIQVNRFVFRIFLSFI